MTTKLQVRTAHAAVALDPADPTEVGPFRLAGRLGAGGMGTVFLATGPDGLPAAVKMLHPHLLRNPEFLSRFRREAELAGQVSARCTAAVLAQDLDVR